MSTMLCPICNKQLVVHSSASVNGKIKSTYSCDTDRVLVGENGEILLTDFTAPLNIDLVKKRLSEGFDLDRPEQQDEFAQLIIALVKYIETLERRSKEKEMVIQLCRKAQLEMDSIRSILEVTDE